MLEQRNGKKPLAIITILSSNPALAGFLLKPWHQADQRCCGFPVDCPARFPLTMLWDPITTSVWLNTSNKQANLALRHFWVVARYDPMPSTSTVIPVFSCLWVISKFWYPNELISSSARCTYIILLLYLRGCTSSCYKGLSTCICEAHKIWFYDFFF